MKCNGCGREIGELDGLPLAATLSYGTVSKFVPDRGVRSAVMADYHKTLCPRCQHVMKDILLSSDLSEQWDNYDWSLIGDAYVEGYDDG